MSWTSELISKKLFQFLTILILTVYPNLVSQGEELGMKEMPDTIPFTKIKSDILEFWKQRQQNTRSLIANWKIAREEPDGVWSTYQADYTITDTDHDQSLPVLYLLDDQVRFETPRWHRFAQLEYSGYSKVLHKGLSGSTNSKAFKFARDNYFDDSCPQLKPPHHLISLYDGEKQTDFFSPSASGITFVRITDLNHVEDERHPWVEQSIYRPFLLTYRPYGLLQNKLEKDSFHILKTRSLIGDRNCFIMEYPAPNGLRGRCFIDLERDAIILRNLLLREDKIMEQIDTQYQQNSSGEWIPDQWTVILKSHFEDFPGRPQTIHYVNCQLSELTLNASVSSKLFEINYSPGTYLFDEIQQRNLIILKDNETKPLQLHEIAQLDLMNKYPHSEVSEYYWEKHFSIIAILVATCVVFLILRKHSARKSQISRCVIQEQPDESETQS